MPARAFATQGLMTVASRMTRAFARDRGFGHLSQKLQHINPQFKVPAWALIWVSVWTIIFGCICGSPALLEGPRETG